MLQQYHRMSAFGHVVFRTKRPPDLGLESQQSEIVTGDGLTGKRLYTTLPIDLKELKLRGRNTLKDLFGPIAQVKEVRVGKGIVVGARIAHVDVDELLRCFERKLLEDDRIDQAEDGGVRSDTQSKRQNGRGGETGTLDRAASRIAQVLPRFAEKGISMTHNVLRTIERPPALPSRSREGEPVSILGLTQYKRTLTPKGSLYSV
jgi:hypothetical protein